LGSQARNGLSPNPRAVREALLKTAVPCIPSDTEECSKILSGRIDVQGAIDHIQKRIRNRKEAGTRSLSVGLTAFEMPRDDVMRMQNNFVEAPGIAMSDVTPLDW
jgi:hypothetical protein